MSEGLEALSKIKSDHEIILFGFSTCDYEYAKEFDIIEKALKEYEQYKTIEECTNIPFAKISSLKVNDIVYFKRCRITEGKVSSINYQDLIITILDKEGTFTDFMLFHQYGKDRHNPSHCWFGAWALTREELE